MNSLAAPTVSALTSPSAALLKKLDEAHRFILTFPQSEIVTEHLIHGGMYARTIRLAPDTVMMGSLIKLATVLIVQGSCEVLAGNERVKLSGYNVIPGCVGRKQLFLTRGPVQMTMLFPTCAQTIAEAEEEVFAEADQLMSRKNGSEDRITITGQ